MDKVSVPKKFLYVEDDSIIRNLIAKILSIEYDVTIITYASYGTEEYFLSEEDSALIFYPDAVRILTLIETIF